MAPQPVRLVSVPFGRSSPRAAETGCSGGWATTAPVVVEHRYSCGTTGAWTRGHGGERMPAPARQCHWCRVRILPTADAKTRTQYSK